MLVLGNSGLLFLLKMLFLSLSSLNKKMPKVIELNESAADTYLVCLCASCKWGSGNVQGSGILLITWENR